MTTPEGIVENYFVDRVRETGGMVRKLKWIGFNGAPDRMAWWPLKKGTTAGIFFVELKAPGKKPTAQQKDEHDKLRASGLKVVVISNKASVDNFIDNAHMSMGRLCL